MNTPAAAPRARRPLLSFSVEGLPARDELLFKSLVRLLDHRTHQHWDWQVQDADLRVVGDKLSAPPEQDPAERPVPLLTIGDTPPPHGPFLRLPLQADALEAMLNRLGAMLVHARELGLAAASRSRSEQVARGEEYRLLRWPSSTLLDTSMRMKLATLLATRPATPQALQQRSGASARECADFISMLERAGFVASSSSSSGGGGSGSGVTGFANSRAPESIWPDSHISSGSEAHHPAAAGPAARANVEPGLLARIRNRLGLLASGPRA
ncbi:hypothetical protein [Variovorax sp. tm]|uniref:hypothetical protein n=1 Tax=Variovorax atrisoli TaxID=3394203 RepID=UPI003A80584E